jgi:hypothetical protein
MLKTALKVGNYYSFIKGVPLYLILDYNRFDKNVLRPIRNYRVVLQ